ncbi:MAG: replication factor C small subunit [Candidatus Pacearchaeota archaeon]
MANEIWTEKYRPEKFSEVVGQDHIIKRISSLTNSNNIPHLLFAGPAGTGKSTLALAVVKELFGEEWKDDYMELNASDERGINVIREKVKGFARTKSIGDVPFKVIFLDEADSLTPEAQQALRRTMENYSSSCRFVLSCNYSSKIIDPIQSRCSIFKFKLLEKKDVKKVIEKIAEKENLSISDEAVETIYEGSEGDCRRSINILQSVASISPNVTPDLVSTVISTTRPKDVKVVLDYALAGDFENAREKLIDTMLNESISGEDMIKAIQKEIWNLEIEPQSKVRLTEKTGEIEFRIIEGSDPFIQLQSLLASFVLEGRGE